jgi:hypothetical protein
MKLPSVVRVALLTLTLALALSGCADSIAGYRETPSDRPSPAALVVNGVIVNELDVLQGTDPDGLSRELAVLGGVVISDEPKLRTFLVWFPTRSMTEIRDVKDALAAKDISANLVFAHAALP